MLANYEVLSFLLHHDLNEIKHERNSRKANASLIGMLHGKSLKLIACFWPTFADFQNQVFSSDRKISGKYELN